MASVNGSRRPGAGSASSPTTTVASAERSELQLQVAGPRGRGGLSCARRLQDAPKRVRTLEERLLETKGQLAQAVTQNEKLTYTLREAREHIAALREEVEKLTQPPSAYGTFLGMQRRRHRRRLHAAAARCASRCTPSVDDADELTRGAEVVLNESLNVVLARAPEAPRARSSPSRSCSRTVAGR